MLWRRARREEFIAQSAREPKSRRRKLWPMCLSEETRSNTATVYVCPDTQLDHFREGRRGFVCLRAASTVVPSRRRWVRNGYHMA
jgi:hypothetical protein